MAAAALITYAFGGDGESTPGVVVDWLTDVGGSPTLVTGQTPTAVNPGTPTTLPRRTPSTPSAAPTLGVSGFIYPIAGACLPEDDTLMPGAPREYRQGIHQGIDFYDSDNCTYIGLDTQVLAAKAGTVVRAGWDYRDLTAETLAQLMERVEQGEGGDPEVEDAFRGRQVWIDHGGGVVTRYAHLDGIADGISVGAEVEQGEVIGYVGESGTPESVTDPGTQIHLHFEIRVGEANAGQGLDPDEVRALYLQAFSR